MLPIHDVNLACQELYRAVNDLGAVGSFIRPNLVNGRYWHSNYWDALYSMHEDLGVTWGFHEAPASREWKSRPSYVPMATSVPRAASWKVSMLSSNHSGNPLAHRTNGSSPYAFA